MAPYPMQYGEMAQDLGRYEELAADWGAPAVPVEAVADDDWGGLHGCCHALRPAADAPRPAADAADADDWGYAVHAL